MPDTAHPIERWARTIMMVLESPDDIRTVDAWSRIAGLSASQLRERCRLAGLSAKESLDFARVLRALLHQEQSGWPLSYNLDVADSRTLNRLLRRVNLPVPPKQISVDSFIDSQQVVTDPVAIGQILACVAVSEPPQGVAALRIDRRDSHQALRTPTAPTDQSDRRDPPDLPAPPDRPT